MRGITVHYKESEWAKKHGKAYNSVEEMLEDAKNW
jgi:hypothetical protein